MDRLGLGEVDQLPRGNARTQFFPRDSLPGVLGEMGRAWVLSLMGVWVLPQTPNSDVASDEPRPL